MEPRESGERRGLHNPGWKYELGRSYALAGRMDEAIKIQTELEAMERRPSPWGMAMFYAALGEKDKGLQELQTMYDSGHAWTPWITAPQFEPLHDDPRYREILRGLNLPDS